MEKYQVHKQIGAGAFSSVLKATNKSTSEVVAIKKMKKKFSTWDECLSLNEIKSLTKLKHPNLIKLIEVIRSNDELFCVFEYAQQTLYSLYLSYKEKGQQIPESLIKSFIYQTTQGLAYTHKNGFFHRDMKPENLLLSEGEIVKIADFGLAREIRSRPPYTDYVSTRWYRAPELLLKSTNYNSPVDIYALGCIMGELYNQSPLFAGNSEIDQLNKICSVLGTPNFASWNEGMLLASKIHYNFPQFNPMDLNNVIHNASDVALALIRDMLNMDPFKRPTAAQILQHTYFNEMTVYPGIYDKNKEKNAEASPNLILKKNKKIIIKDKKQTISEDFIDSTIEKKDLPEFIEKNQDLARNEIKTPGDSPDNINPDEIFRKIKKRDDNALNFVDKLIDLGGKQTSTEEKFLKFKIIEKNNKEKELPEQRKSNNFKKMSAESSLSGQLKNPLEDALKDFGFQDPREFSHSVSPVKLHDKLGYYNENSLDRNKDYIEKDNFIEYNATDREVNKPKVINLFQKKQIPSNFENNSMFQSNKFKDFKETLDIKTKLNLPKLSPIGNIKDFKEKNDYNIFQQPVNEPNYNKILVKPLEFSLPEDNNSNFGFKSAIYNVNMKLPELNKMTNSRLAGGSINNNHINAKDDRNKMSPMKRNVNLDPIQYSGFLSKDF